MKIPPVLAAAFLAVSVGAAWLPGIAPSRAEPPPREAPDFAAVDAQVQTWIDAGHYPGAGLWIVDRDGHTLHERYWNGYGRDTPVMIASATKWLEAATMMTLVDEGKLDLDRPISTYLPELDHSPQGQNTLRQMYSHTSSLNSVAVDDQQGAATFPTQLARGTATLQPGELFSYGGTALVVGWDAVERVTGLPWHTVFARRVARPLRMKSVVTGQDLWTYQGIIGADLFPRADAADYMNFLCMMLNDGMFEGRRVLSPAAVREMGADQVRGARVQAPEYPEATLGQKHHGVYGLGEWRLMEDGKGEATVLSSPSFAGFLPWIDRDRGVAGVFVGRATGRGRGPFDAFHESAKLIPLVRAALEGGAKAGPPLKE